MKIIILQENLKKYLNLAEKITGRNLTLPILSNVILTTDKNRLKISATDLDIALNIWVSAKIEKEGSVAVPAKLLNNFINQLPNQKLTLENNNNTLNIKTEGFDSVVNTFNSQDFPLIPKIKNQDFLELENSVFKNSLLQVLNSASISETRPEISGVFFNKFKLVATDGFRLAEKNLQGLLKKPFLSFILPLKAAQELTRFFDLSDGSKTKIFSEDNQVLFDLSNIHLISRLIEGEYPNYEAIIPQNHQTRIILNKEELINKIRIGSVFSSKINDVKIKTNLSENKLDIITKSESGENNSTISLKGEGEDLEISFNYKYLLDGLLNINGEEVIFEFQNSSNPALLKSQTDPSYLYVVMPLRTA